MSLKWSWKDFWGWYEQLETDQERSVALHELIRDNWMPSLTPDTQAEVMLHAPENIIRVMKNFPHIFKLQTIEILARKRKL